MFIFLVCETGHKKLLLLSLRLTELAKIQTDAIKELEIDKVVVYDNGSGQGVGNFVQGLYGMMPQLSDFLAQSGMSLPEALVQNGKKENGAKEDIEVIQPLASQEPDNQEGADSKSAGNKNG